MHCCFMLPGVMRCDKGISRVTTSDVLTSVGQSLDTRKGKKMYTRFFLYDCQISRKR